MTVEWLLFDL